MEDVPFRCILFVFLPASILASQNVPYTAYTEPEYQGVTNQVPYTGGSTDTYTGKSFNNFCYSVIFFPIF